MKDCSFLINKYQTKVEMFVSKKNTRVSLLFDADNQKKFYYIDPCRDTERVSE